MGCVASREAECHQTWGTDVEDDFDGKGRGGVGKAKSFHETAASKLAKSTFFSENDVVVLKTLFDSVARGDGVIDEGEFIEALFGKKKREELCGKNTPQSSTSQNDRPATKKFMFERRLFEKFDSNDEGYIFFDEFVKALNVFHPRASTNDKAKFAVMKRSIFLNLDEEAIERVLDTTFEQVDVEKDGSISYQEFYRMVKENRKCIANMTMATLATLSTEYPEFIFSGVDEEEY